MYFLIILGLTVKPGDGHPQSKSSAGTGTSLPGIDLDAVAAMMKGGSSRGNLHLGRRSHSHKFWSTAAFIIKTFIRFECHGLFKVQMSVILSKVVLVY
jgi:hypothetical protein